MKSAPVSEWEPRGYLKRNYYDLYPRFDVIEIIVQNGDMKVESINHIENAFDVNTRAIR